MITTDLSPVQSLPLHTRKEVAVGLGFDVLNGRRDSLEIDHFLNIKSVEDNNDGILKARICNTANEVREAVELMFDSSVFQRGRSKITIVNSTFNGDGKGRIVVMNQAVK